MANIVWRGAAQATPQVDTLTVGSNTAGQTFVVTINGKSVTYTATAADTTTTLVATNLAAALEASTEGEFQEITWTSSGALVFATGPDDGAPIVVTESGTGTLSIATTTTPSSPHDVNDTDNWVGGALPGNPDVAVFENSDVSALYNLAALTAVTFGIVRRSSFTGTVGLPDTNADFGYREYRATHLESAGVSLLIEQADGDGAQQIRVRSTGAAVTATVVGPGAGQGPGAEAVELYGAGWQAGAVLNVSGASVAVAPLQGQTATVTTLRGVNATVRVGPGGVLTTATLTDCQAMFHVGVGGTLTMDRGGELEVTGTGSLTTTFLDGGTVLWRSTGGVGTVDVGSDGALDLSQAPSTVAMTAITLHQGATLNDPAERLVNPAVTFSRCGVQDVTLDLGTGFTLTKS